MYCGRAPGHNQGDLSLKLSGHGQMDIAPVRCFALAQIRFESFLERRNPTRDQQSGPHGNHLDSALREPGLDLVPVSARLKHDNGLNVALFHPQDSLPVCLHLRRDLVPLLPEFPIRFFFLVDANGGSWSEHERSIRCASQTVKF